jgi:hypothetical protein
LIAVSAKLAARGIQDGEMLPLRWRLSAPLGRVGSILGLFQKAHKKDHRSSGESLNALQCFDISSPTCFTNTLCEEVDFDNADLPIRRGVRNIQSEGWDSIIHGRNLKNSAFA